MRVRGQVVTRKTVLLITLVLSTAWLLGPAPSKSIELNQEFLKYRLRAPYVSNLTHTIQIHNFGPSETTDVQLYVPIVQNETARHFAVINRVSPAPQKFLKDNGNAYAYWNVEAVPAGHNLTVSINYQVLAFNVDFSVDSSLVGTYDEDSVIYHEHTAPEELIESNHTLIVSTAENVVGEEENPREMALRIYDFVVDRLTYEAQSEEMGALWALQNRRGDCSEHSYLFVALCRAVGIPSRVVTGFAFSTYIESSSEGHMWTEYYLENYGWVPTDLSWSLFEEIDSRHFASLWGACKITEHASYANYYVTYKGNAQLEPRQTVQTRRISINVLDEFPFTQTVYDTISKIQEAELTVGLAEATGTRFLFPSDSYAAKEALVEADLYLQEAVEAWTSQPYSAQACVQTAREKAEEATRLVRDAILKTVGIAVVVPVIAVTAVAVLVVRHRRKEVACSLGEETGQEWIT
ncbi:MAG: transglutaminase-like domain-containing protein [Candidatus Bathyarchaeota archaeon]|nr:transglutaminase-like domain-containing protein [Candidatus Bathyarchaeota archaeon]